MWLIIASVLACFDIGNAKDEHGQDIEIDPSYVNLGLTRYALLLCCLSAMILNIQKNLRVAKCRSNVPLSPGRLQHNCWCKCINSPTDESNTRTLLLLFGCTYSALNLKGRWTVNRMITAISGGIFKSLNPWAPFALRIWFSSGNSLSGACLPHLSNLSEIERPKEHVLLWFLAFSLGFCSNLDSFHSTNATWINYIENNMRINSQLGISRVPWFKVLISGKLAAIFRLHSDLS